MELSDRILAIAGRIRVFAYLPSARLNYRYAGCKSIDARGIKYL